MDLAAKRVDSPLVSRRLRITFIRCNLLPPPLPLPNPPPHGVFLPGWGGGPLWLLWLYYYVSGDKYKGRTGSAAFLIPPRVSGEQMTAITPCTLLLSFDKQAFDREKKGKMIDVFDVLMWWRWWLHNQ